MHIVKKGSDGEVTTVDVHGMLIVVVGYLIVIAIDSIAEKISKVRVEKYKALNKPTVQS